MYNSYGSILYECIFVCFLNISLNDIYHNKTKIKQFNEENVIQIHGPGIIPRYKKSLKPYPYAFIFLLLSYNRIYKAFFKPNNVFLDFFMDLR